MAQKRRTTPADADKSATLRTRLQKVQQKHARKPRSRSAHCQGQLLTDDEAELLAKLAPLLAIRPRRSRAKLRDTSAVALDSIPLEDSELTQRLARAIYEAPSDHAQPLAAPPILPNVPDDEPAELSALPRAAVWVQRANRSRFRAAVRTGAAWLTTLVIISAIVGGTGIALVGVEKSRHLVGRAQAQTLDSLGFVSARLSLFTR